MATGYGGIMRSWMSELKETQKSIGTTVRSSRALYIYSSGSQQ